MANIPAEILWREGMLLLPQHFQQQNSRTDQLIDWRVSKASPYSWGLISMTLDLSALVHGQLRIQQLEAIMPDGFVVQYPDESSIPLELDLTPQRELLRGTPTRVSLLLPKTSARSAGTQGELPRYRPFQARPVADSHTRDSETIIDRYAPNLTLELTNQPSDQFVFLPILEITCRDEAFSLTSYLPPTLEVAVSSPLGQKLDELARRTREKISFLTKQLMDQRFSMGQLDVEANNSRDTIQSLASNLPELEVLLSSSIAHPFQLFCVLARAVGSMSFVHSNLVPLALRPYDHMNAINAFDEAINFLNQCLENIQERYATIAFENIDYGFSLKLDPKLITETIVVGLRFKPNQTEADMVNWMNAAIIASSSKVNEMIELRIRGASRQSIDQEASLELLRSKNMLLFAIKIADDFIDPEGNLHIVNRLSSMADSKPIEALLFTMNTD
jgi:type VI secretion system protein ImpJ